MAATQLLLLFALAGLCYSAKDSGYSWVIRPREDFCFYMDFNKGVTFQAEFIV
jgi:hypothetical protein